MNTYETKTVEEFQGVVKDFFPTLDSDTHVVAFVGDLGTGKTTAVQYIAEILGISEPLTSPTFTLAQFYRDFESAKFDQLIHIDAYRLDDYSELKVLGFEEWCNDPKNLICIEWPNQVSVPEEYIDRTITITHMGGAARSVQIV